jgi:hypothetical protein
MSLSRQRIFLILALSSGHFLSVAQPAGYYGAARGLCGEALKTALHNFTDNNTVRSYDNLLTDLQTINAKTNDKVLP